MPKHAPAYIEIRNLPPELQEVAVAYLDQRYGKAGPVTVPDPPDRKHLLWCGHRTEAVKKDDAGVELCGLCSG